MNEQEGPQYQPYNFIAIHYDSRIPSVITPLIVSDHPLQLDKDRVQITREENDSTRLTTEYGPISGGYLLAAIISSSSEIERYVLTVYPRLDHSVMEEPLLALVQNSSPESLSQPYDSILSRLPTCSIISDRGITLENIYLGPEGVVQHRIFQFSENGWWVDPNLTGGEVVRTDGTWQGSPDLPYRFNLDGPYLFEYMLMNRLVPIDKGREIIVNLKIGIEFPSSDFTTIEGMVKSHIESGSIKPSELEKAVRFYCG